MEHAPTQTSKPPLSHEQCKDAGMALVLLLLLFGLVFFKQHALPFAYAAMGVLVLNMIYPPLFRAWAKLWYGATHVLGTVMSKVILSIIFFLVVTPVGIARQWLGKDSMKLKGFKANADSVMTVRNHTFVGRDLEKPY